MASVKDIVLGDATVAKQSLLNALTPVKQVNLANKPTPPALLQRATDPNAYASLPDYEKFVGPATPEIAEFFTVRELKAAQTRHNSDTAQRLEREEAAFATDAEVGTPLGQVKQFGAAATSMMARMGQHLVSGSLDMMAIADQLSVDPKALELFNKEVQYNNETSRLNKEKMDVMVGRIAGDISSEEEAVELSRIQQERESLAPLSNEEESFMSAPKVALNPGITEDRVSYRDRLNTSGFLQETSQQFREAVDGTGVHELLNPLNRDRFLKELGDSYAENSDYFARAEDAVDSGNHGEAIMETATGIASLVAAGTGDIINNPAATFEFIAENVPQLATGLISAKLLAVTNYAYGADIYGQAIEDYKQHNNGALPSKGDAALMLGMSLSASAMEQVADTQILKQFKKIPGVSSAGVETAQRMTNKVINNALTRTAVETAKGAVREGVTEVYQTAVEENFSRLNIDVDGESLFQAGVIGAAVGGALSGAGRGANEIAAPLRANALSELASRANTKEQLELFAVAVKSGDVSGFLDPENKATYSPSMAAGVLAQRMTDPEITPEDKTTSQTKLDELVATQQAVVDELVEKVKGFQTAEEVSEADLAQVEEDLPRENALLRKMKAVSNVPVYKEQAAPEAVDEISAQENPEEAITLLMQTPLGLTETQTDAILENPALNPGQRKVLTAYKEAKTFLDEVKTSEQVTLDILQGTAEFKGVAEYESDFTKAIRNNDIAGAQKELEGIRSFYTDHKRKAAAIAKAKETAAKTGKKAYAFRDERAEGNWRVTPKKPSSNILAKPYVAYQSERGQNAATALLDSMELENNALLAKGKQLRAILDLFSSEAASPAAADATPVTAPKPPIVEDVPATENTTPTEEVEISPEPVQETEPSINNEQTEEVITEPVQEEATPVDEFAELREAFQEKEAEEEKVVEVEEGNLPNLTEPLIDGDPIAGKFNQDNGSETATTNNPLVDIKNFMSTLFSEGTLDIDLLAHYLKIKTLTERQSALIGVFADYASVFNQAVEKNIKGKLKNPDYLHRDYIQVYRDDPPENLLIAVSVAAFTWITENGNNLFNTDEDIKSILGLENDSRPSSDQLDLLRYAGTRENLVVQELGKRAAKTLGLRANPDAPKNTQTQMELSLGAHALAVLLQQGMVIRNPITSDLLARSDDKEVITQPFIQIAQQDLGKTPVSSVATVVDAARDTGSILNKLFSVESSKVFPASEPGGFDQPNIKGTTQKVPSILSNILTKMSGRKHRLRQDMKAFRNAVSNNTNAIIAGGRPPVGYIHDKNRKSIESKNREVFRDIEQLKEFEESAGNFFYFIPKAWVQQRVGLSENQVNPQTSKYQRHNISMSAWEAEVDPKVDDEVLTRFKLAVAQGMGIAVDKQLNALSLTELEALMEAPEVTAAVEALSRITSLKEGELLTQEEQKAIIDATELAGENFHSLDALINWAAYKDADTNNSTFKTEMMFEVDGVTNGPALAHISLGVIDPALGALFGFYQDGQDYSSYTEYKSVPGNPDLYELVASDVNQHLKDNSLNAAPILYFTGDITDGDSITSKGRKLVKQPLTAMVFGSSVASAVFDMSSSFVDLFYERLEQDANSNQLSAVHNTIDEMNKLISKAPKINKPGNLDEAMQLTLTPQQVDAIRFSFKSTVGKAVEGALSNRFSDFLTTRDSMNNAAQALWARYDAAYDFLYRKKVREKIEEGTLPYTTSKGVKVPWQDLTSSEIAEIEADLEQFKPIVATVLSKASGEADAGIDVSKTERKIVPASDKDFGKAYSAEVSFGQSYPSGKEGKEQFTTMSPRGTKEIPSDPGVRAVIMLVHALDSAIAAYSYASVFALNIHDALGLGLNQVVKGAKALNNNTYNILAGYSLPQEIHSALQKSFTAEEALVEKHPGLKAILANVKVGKGTEQAFVDEAFLTTFKKTADTAEFNKLDFLENVTSVDQYALEGGTHKVTTEQKSLVAKKKKIAAAKEGTNTETKEERPLTRNAPETTPFGIVGEPVIDSNPELVKAFTRRPVMKATAIMPALVRAINASTLPEPIKDYQRKLLKQLRNTIDGETRLRYITPTSEVTEADDTIAAPLARGWYSLDGNGKRISIKSPEFKDSGITTELLLHELTHAALAQLVARYNKPGFSPGNTREKAILEAIKELESLQEQAKQFVESNGLSKYDNAVSNLQEMVAYGMTSPAFQQEVLAEIQVENTTAPQRVAESGLVAFIKSITTALFGKLSSVVERNGMGVMLANTGLLFEAAQQENTGTENITLQMASNDPRTFSSQEIFQALGVAPHGKVNSPIYTIHLKKLLRDVTSAVYGSGGVLRASALRSAPATAEDVYLNALASGEAPFASALTANLRISDQEAFVAESIEVTVRETLKLSPIVHGEMRKLFNQAKAAIKPHHFYNGDWDKASQTDRDTAQATWDLMFTVTENDGGGSNYLSQFVAAALSYEPMYTALRQIDVEVDNRAYAGKSLGERIKIFFSRLMNFIIRMHTRTSHGQDVTEALGTLTRKLATIESRKQATLKRKQESPGLWLEKKTRVLTDAVKSQVERMAGAKAVRESKHSFIRAAGAVTRTIAGDRVEKLMEGIKGLRDGATSEKLGIVGEIYNEMRNGRIGLTWANDLLDKMNTHEQSRKHVMIETGALVEAAFARPLTQAESSAMADLLRVDASNLLGKFSLAQLDQMLSDPKVLDTEIANLEAQLTGPHKKYYTISTKGLGYFLATGKVSIPNLMLNAHNIAFLANTKKMKAVSAAEGNAAQVIIDPLATLYALRYTGEAQRSVMADVMKMEAVRTNDNGVELILKMHKALLDESREVLFEGSPVHTMKGYTKDIYNPYIEVMSATADEGSKLEQAGYKKVSTGPLPVDPTDPSAERKYMYVIRDKGLASVITGFFSNTGRRRRGSSIHGGVSNLLDPKSNSWRTNMNDKVAQRNEGIIEDMFNVDVNFDPADTKERKRTYFAPVLNQAGRAVNYRYLMANSSKDSLLERNNQVDKLLGNLAGSVMDKAKTPGLNEAGVDAMKNIYDEEFLKNPDPYIEFSEESNDPSIRERYRLLPDETKNYIRKVWGRDGMWVRNDVYNIAFGYRTYSVDEMFEKQFDSRNYLEKFLVGFLEKILGKKAALRLVRVGDVWQAVVKMVKDIWVIKNLFTLLGNESSNFSLLLLAGVNPITIVKEKVAAYGHTLRHQKDRVERDNLKKLIDYRYITGQDRVNAEQRIIELNDAMQNNPVRELIDAGMFQTLVEDISTEDDPYSYKSRISRWANNKTEWIPDGVKTVGKNALLMHGTPTYKLMNQATVLSDFTSRVVLYKHLTERSRNPLSKSDALHRARQAFVNYDVPTHKALQYLNDMGLLWFTKYYLRIQEAIFQLVKENPLRALALYSFDSVYAVADILDSNMFNKSPVNLGAGALEFPGAIDEIITLRTAASVLD